MDEMYHVCRWCKHYENGNCTRDNFILTDVTDNFEDVTDITNLIIKEPESFYCKDWE